MDFQLFRSQVPSSNFDVIYVLSNLMNTDTDKWNSCMECYLKKFFCAFINSLKTNIILDNGQINVVTSILIPKTHCNETNWTHPYRNSFSGFPNVFSNRKYS